MDLKDHIHLPLELSHRTDLMDHILQAPEPEQPRMDCNCYWLQQGQGEHHTGWKRQYFQWMWQRTGWQQVLELRTDWRKSRAIRTRSRTDCY